VEQITEGYLQEQKEQLEVNTKKGRKGFPSRGWGEVGLKNSVTYLLLFVMAELNLLSGLALLRGQGSFKTEARNRTRRRPIRTEDNVHFSEIGGKEKS